MHYLLPCSCGQKVPIQASQAGGQVSCACGKSLSIPTLRGIRSLEVAETLPDRPVASWSKWQGILFSGGLFLATIGGVILVLFLYRFALIGGLAVDRSEDFIKGGAAQIDTLSPAQTLELWSHEVLEEGLGEPEPPYWVKAKEKVAEYSWWMKLGGGMIGTGILAAVAAMLFPGRR